VQDQESVIAPELPLQEALADALPQAGVAMPSPATSVQTGACNKGDRTAASVNSGNARMPPAIRIPTPMMAIARIESRIRVVISIAAVYHCSPSAV